MNDSSTVSLTETHPPVNLTGNLPDPSVVIATVMEDGEHPTIYVNKRPRGRPRKHLRPGDPIIIYVPDPDSKGDDKKNAKKNRMEQLDRKLDSIVLDDFEDIHYKLEVIEHRIQVGDDQQHDHPAMSIGIYKNNFVLKNLTYREKKLKTHYAKESIEEQRPGFWEPRPWDKNMMSVDDSKALKEKIAVLTKECNEIKHKEDKKRRGISGPKYKEKRMEQDFLDLDTIVYDSEDDSPPETPKPAPAASPARSTPVRTRSSGPLEDWREEKPVLVKICSRVYNTDDSDGTDFCDF